MSPIIDYIQKQDQALQDRLKQIYHLFKEILPNSRDKISYQMPTLWQGKNLIHFGAFKKHIGIYPGPQVLLELSNELEDFETSKGTLKISHDQELPIDLLKKIALLSLHNNVKKDKGLTNKDKSKLRVTLPKLTGKGPKTQITDQSPRDYIQSIEKEIKRQDSLILLELFEKITGYYGQMWGPSIIGFGAYEYQCGKAYTAYASRIGFAPGKSNRLSLYLLTGDTDQQKALLDRLGKHKPAKACLYVNKLADIDLEVLKELIQYAWNYMDEKFPRV